MITNGWAYLLLGLGLFMNSPWMTSVATVYLTALWLPFTPEKIVTLAIAIWLMTILFPNDQKTLAVLREELKKAKEMIKSHKNNKNSDKSS
jgi:Na+/melibiose symporter-like transporter